jgi:dolichol-phosphate mannosyltransferase
MLKTVSVVVPLFNEEDHVASLVEALARLTANRDVAWEFVLVNDGSSDRTRERLLPLLPKLGRWKYLHLSRNFGQQPAYRAGLAAATGDAVVFLDADLQDPPELIGEMIALWKSGAKLVTACRRSRAETGVRRMLFDGFHTVFHRITGGAMPRDSGTFGLMDRVIVNQLLTMPELNVFLPALRCWAGFRQEIVWYDRQARAGEPRQSLHKLISYAWNGITSFSTIPLRMISFLGLAISVVGFGYGLFLVGVRLLQAVGYFQNLAVPGFTTVAVAILCLGGIQLLCLGIIGEYINKVYVEVKRRPPFIVEEVLVSPHES